MKSISRYIGTGVLILWGIGLLGFIDFWVCVGPVGTCNAQSARTRTV